MGIAFIFLTVFTLFQLRQSLLKPSFSGLFYLRIIGLDIVLFSLIIFGGRAQTSFYIAGLSNLNTQVFFWATRLHIPYYTLIRILNWGVCLFIVSTPLILKPFLEKNSKIDHINTICIPAIVTLGILLFLVVNDPKNLYLIFLKHVSEDQDFSLQIINFIMAFQIVFFFSVLFIYPTVVILISSKKARLYIKKKQNLLVLTSLILLNVFFCIYILNPGFNYFKVMYRRAILLEVVDMRKFPNFFHNTIPLLLMISTEIFLLYLRFSHTMNPSDMVRKRIILNNSKSLRKNLGGIFHIFKNNYFSLYCKCISIQERLPLEYKEELTPLIESIQTMQDNLKKLSSSVNRIHLNPGQVNVSKVIGSTIKIIPHEGIAIEFADDSDATIIGDPVYLSEALTNILNNSVESIRAHIGVQGRILIKTDRYEDYVSIAITDNGLGMDKQTKSKILRPQFSTKSSSSNWGLGLTFSYRVISAHLGTMNIESEKGKGTTIEILLPFQGTIHNEY